MGRYGLVMLVLVLALGGCAGGTTSTPAAVSPQAEASSAETSIGAAVSQDRPDLPGMDSAGNAPEEVLLAYIRAVNRQDWKTRWALIASPEGDYAVAAAAWAEDPVPYDDFTVHETRIVEPGKALVRVTYTTIGFSSVEGLAPEGARSLVVVREPGEWWVLEKGDADDAVWKVTFKGPGD